MRNFEVFIQPAGERESRETILARSREAALFEGLRRRARTKVPMTLESAEAPIDDLEVELATGEPLHCDVMAEVNPWTQSVPYHIVIFRNASLRVIPTSHY